jgi:D-threo-aldose 1-dehydrogenase
VADALSGRVVHAGPFGLGCAPLGNLFTAIGDDEAALLLETAWNEGVRWFDTAPHYGLGLSERRLGAFLRTKPRDDFTLSTKVGRLLVPNPGGETKRDPEGFDVPAELRREWDFSGDGVRRSIEASLERLGLDAIDLALLHDPFDHTEQAIAQAYPALDSMRRDGSIRALGVGTRDTRALTRFVTETDVDAVMVAGRFTLLDQSACYELLPACESRGVAVLNAGVFNSGLLATTHPGHDSPFEYGTAPGRALRQAQQMARVCRDFGTTLPAAALAFARSHPAIEAIVVGLTHPWQVRENIVANDSLPPDELWNALARDGLLRSDLVPQISEYRTG